MAVVLLLHASVSISQNANVSGVINAYSPVTNVDTVQCPTSISVANPSLFAVGDTVLIIQMKGADFDSSNTAAFGTINSIRGAGNYEIARITAIAAGVFTLNGKLGKYYDVNGYVQLVRMPSYDNVNVTGPSPHA